MSSLKQTLLDINNAYIFFCSSIYLGMFWTLHFFFFPHYPKVLNIHNYYDAIIPQTTTATKYFFVTIPIMCVAIVIMLISEWKSKLKWLPIAWIPGLMVPVVVQQKFIEDINDQFKAGITDPDKLQVLLQEWMCWNNVRFVVLAIMWGLTMYYFIAKTKQKVVIS